MTIRRIQGLALIVGAVISLIVFFGSDSTLFHILGVITALLFIFGIPAVHTTQRSGSLGLIGIVLLILAALVALGFKLDILGHTGLDNALIITSIVSGLLGRIITGWLTITKKVFSQWIGWVFILEGLLNTLAGLVNFGTLTYPLSIVVVLLGAAALLGYGFRVFQKSGK